MNTVAVTLHEFISTLLSCSSEMPEIGMKCFIQPETKLLLLAMQSEKFWFHVNPKRFNQIYLFIYF